jgi:hypothetical protein
MQGCDFGSVQQKEMLSQNIRWLIFVVVVVLLFWFLLLNLVCKQLNFQIMRKMKAKMLILIW